MRIGLELELVLEPAIDQDQATDQDVEEAIDNL